VPGTPRAVCIVTTFQISHVGDHVPVPPLQSPVIYSALLNVRKRFAYRNACRRGFDSPEQHGATDLLLLPPAIGTAAGLRHVRVHLSGIDHMVWR
jgi:hypothetical protein